MSLSNTPITRSFSLPFANVISLGETFVELASTRQAKLAEANTLLIPAWYTALSAEIEALKLLPVIEIRRAEGRQLTELRDDELEEAQSLLQALYRAAPAALPGVNHAADVFGRAIYTAAGNSPERLLTAVRMGAQQAN